MVDRATGHSRGFGFVTFGDRSGFDACYALMGSHQVDGIEQNTTSRIPPRWKTKTPPALTPGFPASFGRQVRGPQARAAAGTSPAAGRAPLERLALAATNEHNLKQQTRAQQQKRV
jgi:hypothetical protein